MVAHGADVMLRLPDPPALYTCSGVQGVNDAPPIQVLRGAWCGKENADRRPRPTRLHITFSRRTEQEPKSWPGWPKLRRRRHGKVQLQRVGQEEDAVRRGTPLQVDKPHPAEVVDD